jgi:hypothetical protein
MGRRNAKEYIARAERDVDNGWEGLSIFGRDRASALLSLITATDDHLRLNSFSQHPERQFMATRFVQEALRYAVPRIFERCAVENQPIPREFTDDDYLEGRRLAEYAEAYDAAVLMFSSLHQGRFNAVAERGRPRIRFEFASEEEAILEREKKAYESSRAIKPPSGIEIKNSDLQTLARLGGGVTERAYSDSGDRVAYRIDDLLIEVMREVLDVELRTNVADVPDRQEFAGIAYNRFRRYRGALASLSHAQEFLHMSLAVGNIKGGALSSLSLRLPLPELNGRIATISEVDEATVQRISSLFLYDGSQPTLDCITQPLLLANSNEVIVPRAHVRGAAWERNFLKLFAKHPQLKSEYDKFSSEKEAIALPEVISALQSQNLFDRERHKIRHEGRTLTDVDIVAYDPSVNFLLIMQHKWLIEPDSLNESRTADEELRKGIAQAAIGTQYFAEDSYRQSVGFKRPVRRVEGMVICRGLEPTGFLKEVDIPVVTEEWLVQTLPTVNSLEQLYEMAKQRPDRKQIAAEWQEDSREYKIAGYTLVLPALSRPVP